MAGSRVRDCVNAAVDALKVDATLLATLGTSKVGTHLAQGTDAPYVLVMGGDEIPWAETMEFDGDDGDSGGRQVDVLVQCVSTYRGTSQVDTIADRVMEVLTSAATWSAVSGFAVAVFIRNAAQPPIDLNSDGVLWFARQVTVRVTLV